MHTHTNLYNEKGWSAHIRSGPPWAPCTAAARLNLGRDCGEKQKRTEYRIFVTHFLRRRWTSNIDSALWASSSASTARNSPPAPLGGGHKTTLEWVKRVLLPLSGSCWLHRTESTEPHEHKRERERRGKESSRTTKITSIIQSFH